MSDQPKKKVPTLYWTHQLDAYEERKADESSQDSEDPFESADDQPHESLLNRPIGPDRKKLSRLRSKGVPGTSGYPVDSGD